MYICKIRENMRIHVYKFFARVYVWIAFVYGIVSLDGKIPFYFTDFGEENKCSIQLRFNFLFVF